MMGNGAVKITIKTERVRKQVGGERKRYVAIGIESEGLGRKGTAVKKNAAEVFNAAMWECNLASNQIIKDYITDYYDTLIRRSPVLTGAYRASHEIHANGISIGHEHDGFSTEAAAMANPSIRANNRREATAVANDYLYQWNMTNYNVTRNGDIKIVNNRPYAAKIEGQTASGVYMLALMKVQAEGV
jgi:hypothetical protein